MEYTIGQVFEKHPGNVVTAYDQTGVAPTVDEFKAGLLILTWSEE